MDDLPLRMVSALVRALGHRIRTPLSVVSNELSVYKSLLPDEDVARLIDRCRGISELIREVTVPRGSAVALSYVGQVLGDLGIPFTGDAARAVRVGPEQLSWICGALRRLTAEKSEKGWSVSVEQSSTDTTLCVPLPRSIAVGELLVEFTLTGFFNEYLDLDTIEAPVLDALLLAVGGRSLITAGPPPMLHVLLPTESKDG